MGEALFLFADREQEINTSLFRVAIPQKYLLRVGHKIEEQYALMFDARKVKPVVLLERLVFPDLIRLLRLSGAERIVATFDDAYHLMPDEAGSKDFWSKDRLEALRKGVALCDLTLVPSTLLAQDYSKFGKTKVMPNYHDDEMWPEPEYKKWEGPYRIGWGGSLGHARTWQKSNLLEAMRELKRRYGNSIEYMICGKIPPAIANSDLQCGFIGQWTPFHRWPTVVRSFHIGVAPLAGAYDRRRSALKIIEYGLAGIPFVASDDGEYTISNPRGGVLVKDRVSEWVAALVELIEHPDDAVERGKEARLWAEDYLMSRNTEAYEDVLLP